MIEKVVVSMAQLNQTAGDLEGNFRRIAEAAEKAKHSDILVTPELSLCGYPPEDLLFLDSFLEDCARKLNELNIEIKEKQADTSLTDSIKAFLSEVQL